MEDETQEAGLPAVVVIERPSRTEYVDRHVTINRAPTDKSVELLREMEAKARAEVDKTIRVANTHFECVVHQYQDALNHTMNWRAIFSLNGKKLSADADCDLSRLKQNPDMHEHFAKLRDAMAKEIAAHVLNDAFVAMIRGRRTP
jgi:hypothetical protein